MAADGAGCLLGEVGAGKGVQQARQDGLVELVGGQPLGWAGLLAVALERKAGVVAVAVADGGGADVVQPAVGAHELAGHQVVGGVAGAGAAVLAALLQQPLGGLEGGGVDQGRVGSGVVLAAVVDLAEADAVAQHGDDRGVAPGPAGAGAVTGAVEPGGDRAGAVPLAGVAVEDDGD